MNGPQSCPVAVLGAGSWGTALAILLARGGRTVRLWGRDPALVTSLRSQRRNPRYLPDHPFPPGLEPEADLGRALEGCADVLLVVPSHAFRALLEQLRARLTPAMRIAWATKGLEPGTGRLLHTVVADVLGPDHPTAVISGPTFAREVAAGLPTAVTVASAHRGFAQDLVQLLHGESFRAYTSADMVGVELGGAVKNVLAIAAGISDGLGFGANSRAALITRGLAELMRLGEAVGGQRDTFMGLAGVGDLVLTCTDDQSRNRRLGLYLGQGMALQAALEKIQQVVEGVGTARETLQAAARHGVEMPITEQVYRVLHEGLAPRDAVQALLQREPKAESR
ncbi:MAG: NAD(P)H-dependent glycerol-3-phosphate dehydrogenase [Gammaproteobacteria bacterium]